MFMFSLGHWLVYDSSFLNGTTANGNKGRGTHSRLSNGTAGTTLCKAATAGKVPGSHSSSDMPPYGSVPIGTDCPDGRAETAVTEDRRRLLAPWLQRQRLPPARPPARRSDQAAADRHRVPRALLSLATERAPT